MNIFNQLSNDGEIEFIFIDDGSSKKYKETYEKILKVYSNKKIAYSSIPWIKTKNQVCKARNLWASMSNFEYLVFIDQDTVLWKNYLENLSSEIKKIGNSKVFFGPYYGYNNLKKQIEKKHMYEFLDTWNILDASFQDFRIWNPLVQKRKHAWKYFCWSNICIKRNIYSKVNWFDEWIISWGDEDTEFWYRISQYEQIKFQENIPTLNISKKLYSPPFNILEDDKVKFLFDNTLRNLKKHKSIEYLTYILERFQWINEEQKKMVSPLFKNFIKCLRKKEIS